MPPLFEFRLSLQHYQSFPRSNPTSPGEPSVWHTVSADFHIGTRCQKKSTISGYLSLSLSRFHQQRTRAPLLNTDKRFLLCFLGVVIGINSQRLGFVRRLKERSNPLLFPTERLHNERFDCRDRFASVRPYLSLHVDAPLTRLLCRGAGYGVVVGIGLFFSVFMLGLTWIQVSSSPGADRTGR